MSKVTQVWYSNGQGYKLACGHTGFNIGNRPRYSRGDKIPCDVCADTEKRVKAARVEALEEAKQTIMTSWPSLTDSDGDIPLLQAAIDKLIESTNKLIEATNAN